MRAEVLYKKNSTTERVFSKKGDVFLERIPDDIYRQMVKLFSDQYHFQNGLENGGKMRLANYYVGIGKSLSDTIVRFVEEIEHGLRENNYPHFEAPKGFKPHPENLLSTELNSGFSFGSFDMAVTENGVQNIEFQAVSTYPVSAAKLNQCLLKNLNPDHAFLFADSPATQWEDFIDLYTTIIAGDLTEGVVITDRLLAQQKTSFEFYATQKELKASVAIVDRKDIFEKNNILFYSTADKKTVKINRLYNRILLAEVVFEEHYPEDTHTWKFRFDKNYKSLKFINHPIKLYDVSKRLSPYMHHPLNPDCFELSASARGFKTGELKYDDYIWKHKWGGAGHRLILSPDATILKQLSGTLDDYIAQKKVDFEIFKTDDGQEKIVEIRFMTAHHNNKCIIVPMARLGHVIVEPDGRKSFKIHFGDNNKAGYGFSPVLLFED